MKKILIPTELGSLINKKKSILNRQDVMIFEHDSNKDALDIHISENANLIIAELDSPLLGGEALCNIIRNDDQLWDVSIILICNDNHSEIRKCLDCNANSYITRPLDHNLISEQISKFLNIPRRASLRVLLKVTVNWKHTTESFYCYSQNISSSGILLEKDKYIFDKGDILSCSFFIPNSERITADGEIARVVQKKQNIYQYGIKFTKISESAKSAIESLVKKRSG